MEVKREFSKTFKKYEPFFWGKIVGLKISIQVRLLDVKPEVSRNQILTLKYQNFQELRKFFDSYQKLIQFYQKITDISEFFT